ncbi:hypothetical protein A3726_15275 [Erythrobacter sp. HI0037]|nr:hypothetical protein A3719_07260 [Erythrobacter sp. HI0020]KZY10536.1 hypothetical protein A3726_15275 [Erythrobacter sp. HI0037]KZY17435.1 hypothetical protein A3727_00420 [Erythrobacter sp. HI0038]KZY18416.1 hypothetical protein A3727_16375 [Erythrobacter sp. HI0038]
MLLFSLTMFVLSINLAGERFHRGNWRYAFGYFVGSLIFVPLSVSLSEPLGVDGNIVLTIQIVWLVLMFCETATMIPAHIKRTKK